MIVTPNWPAPSSVGAATTTRCGGESSIPYHNNNLALHVGDDELCVQRNRKRLSQSLQLPGEPAWLFQTHSNVCIVAEENSSRQADAAISRDALFPLVVMTADCLPILLCDELGTEIAAIHAGWKGMVNGIIDNTIAQMKTPRQQIIAWIGPGICSSCFEVGAEVYEQFRLHQAFVPHVAQARGERYLLNLPKMAESILNTLGILEVYHSNACTYEQKKQFYSYRRDAQTGRMATLIWFKKRD